ncbi:MAG: hypothetical protein M9962_05165 [Oligoflexia bacterium]|nr:hypothetical protein [Oligoflexia bacterium]
MSPVFHKVSSKKEAFQKLRFSTFRIPVYLWTQGAETPLAGFTFLGELKKDRVGIYLSEKIKKAFQVRIAFEKKSASSFKAFTEVVNRYSLEQKFIGHKSLSYKAELKLIFATEAERQKYLEYIDLMKNKVKSIKPGVEF